MAIIDHIGIAVNSLADALPLYRGLLGLNDVEVQEVPSEGVRVALLGRGVGRIELLEPLDEASPVARFLARRGPGIHHLCLQVPNLESALMRARDAGAEPITPEVRVGAGGSRVAFLHPRSAGGVLLELREAGPAGGSC